MLPSILSLERPSPKGSYHLVGQRYEWHTCSETSLRILLWNASLVHKTIHKKLTGKKWMTRRERQWRRILSKSLLEATVPSDEVSSNSDCENRTVMTHNWCLKFDMPVLGLAGCHSEKWKLMQVRRADQALYHHELTVSSLGSVCQSCTASRKKSRSPAK